MVIQYFERLITISKKDNSEKITAISIPVNIVSPIAKLNIKVIVTIAIKQK